MSSAPQFVNIPNEGTPATLTAANTALDGTGATGRVLIFTAGANGSLLPAVRFMHKGTNVGTVMRIFRNNGSDPEIAGNNVLIDEVPMAANTLSQTISSVPGLATLDLLLAPTERIYVTMGTAVAAGIHCAPLNGGDF